MTTKTRQTTEERLQAHVQAMADWINKLGRGEVTDSDYGSVADELTANVYDVNYTLDANRDHRGTSIMVAGGGPTIWISSVEGVEGYWAGCGVAQRIISRSAEDLILTIYPFDA